MAEAFALVEKIRRTSLRFRREQEREARGRLEEMLTGLDDRSSHLAVRAFTIFAQLSNIAEDLDGNRRYATIEDFRNFGKLAYMAPSIHHSGGTVCEPVDIPVNKRHLDMVYSHIKYSDKPYMGSVSCAKNNFR